MVFVQHKECFCKCLEIKMNFPKIWKKCSRSRSNIFAVVAYQRLAIKDRASDNHLLFYRITKIVIKALSCHEHLFTFY